MTDYTIKPDTLVAPAYLSDGTPTGMETVGSAPAGSNVMADDQDSTYVSRAVVAVDDTGNSYYSFEDMYVTFPAQSAIDPTTVTGLKLRVRCVGSVTTYAIWDVCDRDGNNRSSSMGDHPSLSAPTWLESDIASYGTTACQSGLLVYFGVGSPVTPDNVVNYIEAELVLSDSTIPPPSVFTTPPCRQFPRDDGLGTSSARRHYPQPRSRQRSSRWAGGYF